MIMSNFSRAWFSCTNHRGFVTQRITSAPQQFAIHEFKFCILSYILKRSVFILNLCFGTSNSISKPFVCILNTFRHPKSETNYKTRNHTFLHPRSKILVTYSFFRLHFCIQGQYFAKALLCIHELGFEILNLIVKFKTDFLVFNNRHSLKIVLYISILKSHAVF